ncbi:MAG: hypothetical protein ACK526_03590 [Planctomyces sp.]|jgi:hypothetical protein
MTLDVSDCLTPYEAHGIRFLYPDIWEITEETDADGDIVITVTSDGTCFWTLRILPGCPSPPDVVRSCIEAFREEYDELDESPSQIRISEMPAYARDLEFSCLELLNTASLSSVRSSDMTLLIWWQGTDHELQEIRPILEQITESVQILSLLEDGTE